jgi:2'-5' RNA ligase
MGLLRSFIAIELPPTIQEEIQSKTAELRNVLDSSLVRWVPSRNIHLTLKFLGDTSTANIELLKLILTREASRHPPFEMRISGLGSFPTSRRPRVIWVGLHAPSVLESLQRGIESETARMGYASEERPFSPHLTIGRVRQDPSPSGLQKIRAALESTRIGDLGSITIDAIHLFKSDLQPAGSIYTCLFTAPLNQP